MVTPNPHNHALRRQADLRSIERTPPRLREAGVPDGDIAALSVVPRTVAVTAANADALGERRREYFFKPVAGYGSKRVVYRGDKLTLGVGVDCERIRVAQAIAPARASQHPGGRPDARA